MAELLPPTPYFSGDWTQLWFRRDQANGNEARRLAKEWARDTLDPGEHYRFKGEANVMLHDHEDWETCEACEPVAAWGFEAVFR